MSESERPSSGARDGAERFRDRDALGAGPEVLVVPTGAQRIELGHDPLASRCVAQPCQCRVEATLAGPGREQRAQVPARRRVRVDIGGDDEAALPRRIDTFRHGTHASGIPLKCRLEVEDVGGHASFGGNLEHLVERGVDLVALAALVGRVYSAVAAGHAGKGDELLGRSVAVRNVNEGARDAQGPILHGGGSEALHRGKLGSRRSAILAGHHGVPQASRGHEGGEVYCWRRGLEAREEVREGGPIRGDAEARHFGLQLATPLFTLGRRREALARDHQRDALADLRCCAAVGEERPIAGAHEVDEAGRHHAPVGLEPALRRGGAKPANGGDPTVTDADVGGEAGRSCAVDDNAPRDEQIEAHD